MTHDSRPMTLDQRPATTDPRRNVTIDSTKGIAGLKGALRYVRAYRDHVFVVKLGGDVLADREVLDQVAAQLALLYSLSIRLVVVQEAARKPAP
jgi:Acetylglutamate kinase